MGKNENVLSVNVNSTLATIDFNFDELKERATEIASSYMNNAITEDTYMSAKADAKLLGGYIKDIENRRKETKKILEAPIKEFEGKCKELSGILKNAKDSIEAQTEQFDDVRRAQKKQKAEEYIKTAVQKAELGEEYASRIVYKDSYHNLTGTFKAVKEDIDSQVATLKKESDLRSALISVANATMEIVNQDLEQKVEMKDISDFIEMVMNESSTRDDAEKAITEQIRVVANTIKERENRIRERAEAELRKKIEQETTTSNVVSNTVPATSNDFFEINKTETSDDGDFFELSNNPLIEMPIVENNTQEERWLMTVRLTGSKSDLKTIGDLLKLATQNNNCTYEIVPKECHKI